MTDMPDIPAFLRREQPARRVRPMARKIVMPKSAKKTTKLKRCRICGRHFMPKGMAAHRRACKARRDREADQRERERAGYGAP
jgi:hypothetical protein